MSDRAVPPEPAQPRTIPDRPADRTWGGPGSGAPCVICGAAVTREQTEIELEFDRDEDTPADTYHVHATCLAVWELEHHRHTAPSRTTSPSVPRCRTTVGSDGGANTDRTVTGFLRRTDDGANIGRRESGGPEEPGSA